MAKPDSGEIRKSPGWFWLLWLLSFLLTVPIILLAAVVAVTALFGGEYIQSAVGFSVFALCTFAYFKTWKIADAWWQHGESRQWMISASLALPCLLYPLLDHIYF